MADPLMGVEYIQARFNGEWTDDVAARAEAWLTTALARARTVGPCFIDPTGLPDHVQEAARGIIAGAVLRLIQDTQGNTHMQSTGPFHAQTDLKQRSDRVLSQPDRDELRQLCRSAQRRRGGGTIRTAIGY